MKDLGIIRRMFYRDGLSLSEIERRPDLMHRPVLALCPRMTPLEKPLKSMQGNFPGWAISERGSIGRSP